MHVRHFVREDTDIVAHQPPTLRLLLPLAVASGWDAVPRKP